MRLSGGARLAVPVPVLLGPHLWHSLTAAVTSLSHVAEHSDTSVSAGHSVRGCVRPVLHWGGLDGGEGGPKAQAACCGEGGAAGSSRWNLRSLLN